MSSKAERRRQRQKRAVEARKAFPAVQTAENLQTPPEGEKTGCCA